MAGAGPWLARGSILLGAALFSTGGAVVKASTLSAWQIACLRCGIAALFLLAVVPAARRWPDWRVTAVAACYAGVMVLFVVSNTLTTAASAIFLQSSAPLYVALLAPLLLLEPVRRSDFLFVVVMLVALLLLLWPGADASVSARQPLQGNLLGGLNGILWALTLLGLRWLARECQDQALRVVVTGNVIAFALCLPMALPALVPTLMNASSAAAVDWAVILWLGVFQIGIAYLLVTSGLRSVPAFEASLLILLEPVLSPVWAWWLHEEVASLPTLAGGALLLIAVTIRAWQADRPARRPG